MITWNLIFTREDGDDIESDDIIVEDTMLMLDDISQAIMRGKTEGTIQDKEN